VKWSRATFITIALGIVTLLGVVVYPKCCHDHPTPAHSHETKEDAAGDAAMMGAHGGHPPGKEMNTETRDH
jgi:hypothetical protein